jgi:hypothetical protein
MIRAKPTRLHPFGRLASCHSGKPYAQAAVLGNHCRGLGATLSSLTFQAALARMRHSVALSLQQTRRPWQRSLESFGSESMPGRSASRPPSPAGSETVLPAGNPYLTLWLTVVPSPSESFPPSALGTIGREPSVLNGCIDSRCCWQGNLFWAVDVV